MKPKVIVGTDGTGGGKTLDPKTVTRVDRVSSLKLSGG